MVNFNGFNDWRKKKRKKPSLSSTGLRQHSQALYTLLSQPFTQKWGEYKVDLENLCITIDSYAQFLEKSNEKQKERQMMDHPARQIGLHSWLEHHAAVEEVHPRYALLDNIFSSRECYKYLLFDETIHCDKHFKDRSQRYYFVNSLNLSVPVHILRYNPGGACGSTVILWRTPHEQGFDDLLNMSLKVFETLKPLLPEYHTRQMKREFINKYCKLAAGEIKPAILRSVYADLTLDASADQNKPLDERIRQALLSEDSDLVTDMRHLNKGRPNDTFVAFFDKLSEKVEEISAADERRHNCEHLSQFISVKDLINQVKVDLPENTPIPSESTVLFSFVPKNSHSKASKLYKSKVPLKFKVQTRQLRSSHQDEHYCSAIFKYMRQYAVKYNEHVSLLCVDDKSKVDYGEPGMAVSSGVRGKKSIAPMNSNLSALDHDFASKGSLTPSVCLNVKVPATMEESFYRGKVNVLYKDTVFKPSNPWRHGCEIKKILESNGTEIPPVLLIYSDGGPDHRVTYHAVKLSLIILFKMLDLDILIACRTAPGHSWLNPAERVMSVLNIALQNAALTRSECDGENEQVLKSLNSMSDIRSKAIKKPDLKAAWLEAVQPVIDLVKDRTARLSLKTIPFQCHEPATDEEVNQFEEAVHTIDESINIGQYQQKQISSKLDYHKFLQDHCRERTYSFQVRKCLNPACCTPRRCPEVNFPWLPDPLLKPDDKEHYQSFESLVGSETSEKDRPSQLNARPAVVAEQIQGIRNAGLIAQNVRRVVKCYECSKPRCVYSSRKLTPRDLRSLNRILETHDYSCGSLVIPDGCTLQVCVRLQMDCSTPVEFPYYADNNPVSVQKDICCYCTQPGCERDTEMLRIFRVVLPVCFTCKESGKAIPKRNPIK